MRTTPHPSPLPAAGRGNCPSPRATPDKNDGTILFSDMVKGLIRFALIWAISMLLTPYLNRFLDRLASRAAKNSFLEELLLELSGRYSATLISAFGETLGELVLGSKR